MDGQQANGNFSPLQGQQESYFHIKGDSNVANFRLILALVLGIGLSLIFLIMIGVCVVFWRLRKGPQENFVVVCESAADEGRKDQRMRSASQKQLLAQEEKKIPSSREEQRKLSKDVLLHELKCMRREKPSKAREVKSKLKKGKLQNEDSSVDEYQFQDLEADNVSTQDFYMADSSNYQVLLDGQEALYPIGHSGVQAFSLKYLQIATNGFAKQNFISESSFGKVYKAYMITGEPVAVEVLYCGGRMEAEKFRKHIMALSQLQSPYLVRLIGYCIEGDDRLLVMEFMRKGSLRDQLHGGSILQRHALNWQRRLHIAYCVAQALVYLHEVVDPPVCHTDLESGNIVLDSSYNAKLADFCVTTILEVETGRNISNNVLGSFTYQAPEFRANGVRTTKGDIFSYGVVLLELLTGRKPIDTDRPKGQQSLVSWVLPQLENPRQLQTMVDPPLKFHGAVEPECFQEFAQIAGRCLEYDPQGRPQMSEVLKMIKKLIAKHVPCQTASTASLESSNSADVQMAHVYGNEEGGRSNSESGSSGLGTDSISPHRLRSGPTNLKVGGNVTGRRKAQKGVEGSKHWTCEEDRSPYRPTTISRPVP